MEFPEGIETINLRSVLPEFSELTTRSSTRGIFGAEYTSGANVPSQAMQIAIQTTTTSMNQKQTSIRSFEHTKYSPSLFPLPDPSTLFQLCEKQGIQTMINIPSYGQNNVILGAQANERLPVGIVSSTHLSSLSQVEAIKQDIEIQPEEQKDVDSEFQVQLQQQNLTMAEYIQKLQATTLPITLQQLLKLQVEQVKKEKIEEEKTEHPQNNILNIPSVPVFRNTNLQNGGAFLNTDQMMLAINPSDLNVHMETEQENEVSLPPVLKVEQQIQTDSPKIEKKPKFRAKIGEIKINVALDGSTLYCCPECNLAFSDKAGIDLHIQAHIQERKYECRECGAMLKRKEHLDQHMRGHSDERPFKCQYEKCEKAFKRNEHLTRHHVIHSGDKNFLCSTCQRAFSRKDHLNKHEQTHYASRKNKIRKEPYHIDQRNISEKSADVLVPRQEINYILKDGCILKQETTFLQRIQNLQKDSNLLHTLSSFKEHAVRDTNMLQQQSVNTNEILPQSTKYLMQS